MKSYTVVLEQDHTGELLLPLPQELLDAQGWAEGDCLEFSSNGNGGFTIFKQDSKKVVIDSMLMGLLGRRDLIEAWWNGSNVAFDLQKPADCDLDQVYSYVISHCMG